MYQPISYNFLASFIEIQGASFFIMTIKVSFLALLGNFGPKKTPRGATGIMPNKSISYFLTDIVLKVSTKFQKFQGVVFEKRAAERTRVNYKVQFPPSSGD